MAGTSAVFISSQYGKASPVERDGMIWTEDELHLDNLPTDLKLKTPIANVLALEGLEDYDPPENGDVRFVDSVGADFVYMQSTRAWIQYAPNNPT
ncbi:MAG: hypothetical protein K6L76_03435 [Agarilytica sp.]